MKIGNGYSDNVPVSPNPEIYTVTTYDEARRYRRAATVFIPVLACTIGFWYLQYLNHALKDSWWFPTIILAIGGAFAFLRLKAKWKVELTKRRQPISKKTRWGYLFFAIGFFIMGSAFLVGGLAPNPNTEMPVALSMVGFAWALSLPFFLLYFFQCTENALTPEAASATTKAQIEIAKVDAVEAAKPTPWYVRYIFGIIFIVGAFNVTPKHDEWWVPLVLVFIGFCFMYEFLIIGILGLIGYAVFGVIAALPTSVAIIIAGFMIANARSK